MYCQGKRREVRFQDPMGEHRVKQVAPDLAKIVPCRSAFLLTEEMISQAR